MAGLIGNPKSLTDLAAKLRALPRVVAIKVAAAAAPVLTEAARATFDAGENAYGLTWAPRADGSRATLRRSGSLESGIHYVAIGTKIRVALGVAYAKYVVGKRPVFPRPGNLPVEYQRLLTQTTADVIAAEMGAT